MPKTETDLFTILTVNIDNPNGKTTKQFKAAVAKLLRDKKTVQQLETYVTKKLKPFGLGASAPTIDPRTWDGFTGQTQ